MIIRACLTHRASPFQAPPRLPRLACLNLPRLGILGPPRHACPAQPNPVAPHPTSSRTACRALAQRTPPERPSVPRLPRHAPPRLDMPTRACPSRRTWAPTCRAKASHACLTLPRHAGAVRVDHGTPARPSCAMPRQALPGQARTYPACHAIRPPHRPSRAPEPNSRLPHLTKTRLCGRPTVPALSRHVWPCHRWPRRCGRLLACQAEPCLSSRDLPDLGPPATPHLRDRALTSFRACHTPPRPASPSPDSPHLPGRG